MPVRTPNFSPFPIDRLPRRTRAQAAIESTLARWIVHATGVLPRTGTLVGGTVRVKSAVIAAGSFDPYSAIAEVRIGSLAIVVSASGSAIRALAQRLLGGPAELAAPRPATSAEHALWSLVLAAVVADVGLDGDVWPLGDLTRHELERDLVERARPTSVEEQTVVGSRGKRAETDLDDRRTTERPAIDSRSPAGKPHAIGGHEVIPIELAIDLGGAPLVAIAWCPADLLVRSPPMRRRHDWTVELPVVVARCALDRAALQALAVRDVVVVERELSLQLGTGVVGLVATSGAIEATVATGYVRRDMALLDDGQLELSVRLGTTTVGLRRLTELAVGEVIALGRPLSGPYEIHVGGRKIGEGELIDIDGEVGVRIVSLIEE